MPLVSSISYYFMSKTVVKYDLKKIIDYFWFFYHSLKHDDLSQNLFLEVKKPEIKETKGTYIIQKLKSSYWGPFSGLKTQDLIKASRIFSGVIFCRRSFWVFWSTYYPWVPESIGYQKFENLRVIPRSFSTSRMLKLHWLGSTPS